MLEPRCLMTPAGPSSAKLPSNESPWLGWWRGLAALFRWSRLDFRTGGRGGIPPFLWEKKPCFPVDPRRSSVARGLQGVEVVTPRLRYSIPLSKPSWRLRRCQPRGRLAVRWISGLYILVRHSPWATTATISQPSTTLLKESGEETTSPPELELP